MTMTTTTKKMMKNRFHLSCHDGDGGGDGGGRSGEGVAGHSVSVKKNYPDFRFIISR
jgi:hypothetical protein